MKVDISLGKNDKISVGDFSSASPSVYVTLKDIDPDFCSESLDQIYENLSNLVNAMYYKQFIESVNEMEALVKVNSNVKKYRDSVEEGGIVDRTISDLLTWFERLNINRSESQE